jgi:catechol 2,3-dioxygenase-like lactoylglutathione lyase family enzyme
MTNVHVLDHIAFAVPNLDEEVERLTGALGMVVQNRNEHYALVADPVSGFKIELNETAEPVAQFRHLGFRTANVDAAHDALVEAGLASTEAPHRREFARMRTAFLREPSGIEVQLVAYDDASTPKTSKE